MVGMGMVVGLNIRLLRLPVPEIGTNCKDTVPKIGKNIPRKETARPQSQFLHLFICHWSAYWAAAR
jgi:hypothetical protein